ncbi:MAG: hypothetical protein ACI8PZ_006557 [Myxococcota bacterium]|jgi:hypothetical protein
MGCASPIVTLPAQLCAVAFSPDGTRLAASDRAGLMLIDVDDGSTTARAYAFEFRGSSSPTATSAVSPMD